MDVIRNVAARGFPEGPTFQCFFSGLFLILGIFFPYTRFPSRKKLENEIGMYIRVRGVNNSLELYDACGTIYYNIVYAYTSLGPSLKLTVILTFSLRTPSKSSRVSRTFVTRANCITCVLYAALSSDKRTVM